jgi:ankyrin repeat protein
MAARQRGPRRGDASLQLVAAVAAGDGAEVRRLLRQGADPNYREDPDEWTLLMTAAERGDLEVVRLLVEAGADVNAAVDDPDFGDVVDALRCAAARGHRAVCDYLGPLTDTPTPGGTELRLPRAGRTGGRRARAARPRRGRQLAAGATPHTGGQGPAGADLLRTAAEGRVDAVRELLAAGADPNTRDKEGKTPLFLASNEETARVLFEAGADCRSASRYGESPLMLAAASGWTDLVQRYLAAGADINAQAKGTGRNAMMYAAGNGRCEVISLLAAAGADPHAKDLFGSNTLRVAWVSGFPECAEALVAAGACDRRMGDLVRAAAAGEVEAVRALLAAGADVDARWSLKAGVETTALHAAAENGHGAVVRILLDAGANVNCPTIEYKRNMEGDTPLLAAARNGHAEIVRLLAEAGADLNGGDFDERPLAMAASAGHVDVVSTLVECGVNTRLKDFRGKSAVDYARAAGHTAVVQLLRRAPPRQK